MRFKGAHLGNAYKWSNVKNAISYEQERDRSAIHEANARTRAVTETRTQVRTPARLNEGDTPAAPQSTGKLQEQLRAANHEIRTGISNTSKAFTGSKLQFDEDGGYDRQPVSEGKRTSKFLGEKDVFQFNIGRDLLGNYSDGDSVDNRPMRKRKRKKGRSL